RTAGVTMIDCQQNTGHLASLGAAEISRAAFAAHLRQQVNASAPAWHFDSLYWQEILKTTATPLPATS
ncbi:MAG: leucyl/phenylalanyl-tRNA--protein transferase, partial [Polaromonas sp.]